jgi:Transmembrane secretion effector
VDREGIGRESPLSMPSPSYRALFSHRYAKSVVFGLLLSRTAAYMWRLTIVLLVLEYFHSPVLAGAVALVGWLPGSLLSPLAGALLDRHKKLPLVLLDYGIAASTNSAIALLAITQTLRPSFLLALVALGSLTGPLSNSGLRTLLPAFVPSRLWDQLNAVDSITADIAAVGGPALAGLCVAAIGPPWTILLIVVVLISAALSIAPMKESSPSTDGDGWGQVIKDAIGGVRYVFLHPILRALIATQPIANVGFGMLQIILPVRILQTLHGSSRDVGFVWACFGLAGVLGALIAARIRTIDREVRWMTLSLVLQGVALAPALFVDRLLPVYVGVTIAGAMTGLHDVALFSLRLRTLDARWLGRAMTISMHLNSIGEPIGAGVAGLIVESHLLLASWIVPVVFAGAGAITPGIFAASGHRAA